MLIALTVLAGIVIGLLAGGSLRHFPAVSIRWWTLALAGLVLQWVPISGDAARWSLLASFALLIVFALVNLRAPGFILILTGLTLNSLVITANSGMPVLARALEGSNQAAALDELKTSGGAKHHLANGDDVLLPLADAIGIPPPVGQAVSVGDLALQVGVAWFVVAALRPRERTARVVGASRSGLT